MAAHVRPTPKQREVRDRFKKVTDALLDSGFREPWVSFDHENGVYEFQLKSAEELGALITFTAQPDGKFKLVLEPTKDLLKFIKNAGIKLA